MPYSNHITQQTPASAPEHHEPKPPERHENIIYILHGPCVRPTWAPGWVCRRVTANHHSCPAHLQIPPACWCLGILHPETPLLVSTAAQPEPLACAPAASRSLYGTCWPHAISSVLPFKAFFFFNFPSLPPLPLLQLALAPATKPTSPPHSQDGAGASASPPAAWGCCSGQGCSVGNRTPSGRGGGRHQHPWEGLQSVFIYLTPSRHKTLPEGWWERITGHSRLTRGHEAAAGWVERACAKDRTLRRSI